MKSQFTVFTLCGQMTGAELGTTKLGGSGGISLRENEDLRLSKLLYPTFLENLQQIKII